MLGAPGDYGDAGRAEGVGRTVDRRFRSSDWLIVIGGILLLIASRLPWWTVEWDRGPTTSMDAFDYGMTGILPLTILLVVTVVTVIIKTDSLPLPDWLVHPYVTAVAVGAATFLVGVRFFWSGFEDTSGVSRGIGLYLAAAAVVLASIGCGLAIRDLRRGVADDDLVADDDDDDDDDDDFDEPDDLDEPDDDADDDYGADDDEDDVDEEEDDLVRRANTSPPTGEAPVYRPSNPVAPRRRTPNERQPAPRRRVAPTDDESTPPPTRRRPASPPLP